MGNLCTNDENENDFKIKSRKTTMKKKEATGTGANALAGNDNESSWVLVNNLSPKIRAVFDAQETFNEDPDTDNDIDVDKLKFKPAQNIAEGGRYEGYWHPENGTREGYGI